MAKAGWEVAKTGFHHLVKRSEWMYTIQLMHLAKERARPRVTRRLGRRTGKVHVMSGAKIDPSKLVVGFDNRKTAWRWNGCSDKFGLVCAEPAFYCSELSDNRQFAAVAAEFGHYANVTTKYDPKSIMYWDPAILFPSSTLLVDLLPPDHHDPHGPLLIFDPMETQNLLDIEAICKPVLFDVTEQMMCLYMEAPDKVKMEYISALMMQELLVIRRTGKGTLSMRALLSSPSYGFSALVGNAALSENIALTAPSARADNVPQQEFLAGSHNVIVPVKKDLSTGLKLFGVHQFEPSSRQFVFTPASQL